MQDKKSFGQYICKRRKELGLTQKDFAEKLYITESAVSKWERGLSYPDITLIRDICEILSVSEHELLTASEDTKARNSEKLAHRYVLMITGYKRALSILYGITILTCFICNIAVQHKLSWFFIVLTALMAAMSITLLPIVIPKNKGLWTLGTFAASISLLFLSCNLYTGGNWFFVAFFSFLLGMALIFSPFILSSIVLPEALDNKKTLLYFLLITALLLILLFVCNLYTGGGWFIGTALPIALFCLALPWGMMLIIRYTKMNKFLKAAGCLALTGIFQYSLQGTLSTILKDGLYGFGFQFNFIEWNENTINGNVNMIIFLILIILTAVFTAYGIYRAIRINMGKHDKLSKTMN